MGSRSCSLSFGWRGMSSTFLAPSSRAFCPPWYVSCISACCSPFGALIWSYKSILQIILAIYYTLADIVLLCQCFYYEGFTLRWNPKTKDDDRNHSETSPLLGQPGYQGGPNTLTDGERHGPYGSTNLRDHLMAVDATHLSPVTPLLQEEGPDEHPPPPPSTSVARTILFNSLAIVLVCSAGVVGWLLGNRGPPLEQKPSQPEHRIVFSPLGQVFGYICAALYLGSRIPQLLLNHRRKSTEGISMLFFVFACIGNLTYVLSIVAFDPVCDRPYHCRDGEAARQYERYIAVNLSWILGSLGTLLLDLGVFVQYFLYKGDQSEDSDRDDADEGGIITEPAVVSRNTSQRREVIYETEGWS
jgi:solute carrier family 66 (lysosomal lysine-arginine transporter), member 1